MHIDFPFLPIAFNSQWQMISVWNNAGAEQNIGTSEKGLNCPKVAEACKRTTNEV